MLVAAQASPAPKLHCASARCQQVRNTLAGSNHIFFVDELSAGSERSMECMRKHTKQNHMTGLNDVGCAERRGVDLGAL
jgi:hypothetical protein